MLVWVTPVVLIVIFGVSLILGRRVGIKHVINATHPKAEIVGVAEGAVFGLLALLMAFTFSGAYDRYENRKMHLVEEANVIEQAYNYTDLMPKEFQEELRANMRQYSAYYVSAVNNVPYMDKVVQDLNAAAALEEKIWNTAIYVANSVDNKAYAQLYLPAFLQIFEQAHTSYYLTQIHPPQIIFILLVVLASLGAFLVGYNAAEHKQRYPLHSLSYVLLTAFTIYIIMNIEYPRIGFIGMPSIDKVLIDLRDNF